LTHVGKGRGATATAQQLSATYSFIGPLLADPVLSAYGDNALPLFAVALHLDVEDVANFATESLTDHPSDKKADITTDGKQAVDAWVKVLRSTLPIISQNLRAEEYQVVRSTEHTEAVAKATKGVVAGAEVLQTSFEDLRKLLKPVQP
jgi:hypothetical protein